MWSFVQKRQIKHEVERAWQRRSPPSHDIARDIETGQMLQSHEMSSTTRVSTEGHQDAAETTSSTDNVILVECESPTDPLNPQNWPLARRVTTLGILGLLVFTQAWAGSAAALAHNKVKAQYQVCTVAANLSTAAYLFGIGSGCLLVGPLSETGGRSAVYLSFSFAYLFFQLGAGFSNAFLAQIICRYFVGLASSGTMGINGASVGDMFTPTERTAWFPVIAWANVVRRCFLSIAWCFIELTP
jgi:DHA1 family multidrug resistance protein-like MFS transporter